MREFNLRDTVGNLKRDLKSALGSRNIVDVTAETRLPSHFLVDSGALSNAIMKIAARLAENLVNGIIEVKFLYRTQNAEGDITAEVKIVGNGVPENISALQFRGFEQVQMDINAAVPQVNVRCDKDGSKIMVAFLIELTNAPDSIDEEVSLQGKKILLAEDNQVNVIVFSSFLEDWGALFSVANNGKEALDAFHAGKYDAVLMDIHMPVMNGIVAIQEIRKVNTEIPIIVLSAVTFQKDIDAALEAGANEFLKKPVSSWELYSALVKFF